MYEPLRRRALALLKVPPAPHPPVGDPASLKVFRAGQNYYRLRLGSWIVVQLLALAGILFWTVLLIEIEATAHAERAREAAKPAATQSPPPPDTSSGPPSAPPSMDQRADNWAKRFSAEINALAEAAGPISSGWTAYKQMLVRIALLLPDGVFAWIWALKIFGFVVYLLQIPITYAVRRLDYEMRWYMVTDRSLRLRHGVWKISESTMSFANLQQVTVIQGPVQRLLGLGDVKVQSAGGGGEGEKRRRHGENMHTGLFHGVSNASEIRDLILERLRRYREAGLGDPDEVSSTTSAAVNNPADPLAAAQKLLTEVRALRVALS